MFEDRSVFNTRLKTYVKNSNLAKIKMSCFTKLKIFKRIRLVQIIVLVSYLGLFYCYFGF